ncbi:MAG: UDP binding domain-containing protein, partial [Pseudomonadota bacterium]
FPKDTLALVRTAQQYGAPTKIVESVVEINDRRKKEMAQRVIEACGGSVAGKTIGVLGLTFKPNTDDMREAPSLEIVPILQEAGARIQAYDPAGLEEAKKLLTDVDYKDGPYAVLDGADAAVVVTEWDEFRALDLERVKTALKEPVFVDLRNIYPPKLMAERGFRYASIGRP